jgi:hypothetical protein
LADNVDITQGAGTSIAADDIGGVKHQRVKISVGADGSATDLLSGNSSDGSASAPGALGVVSLHYDGTVYRAARNAGTIGDGGSAFLSPDSTPYLYNGSTFDRQRGNTEGVLLATAARTAITTTAAQTNHNARGVALRLTITSAGTGTLTVHLRTTSGWNLASFTGLTANALLVSYPGTTTGDPQGTAVMRSMPLPRTWDAVVDKSDASSWTYSLDYHLII